MATCGETLSWDGLLCQCCRSSVDTCFDTHERGIIDEWEIPLDSHTSAALQVCASHKCRLCCIVLDALSRSGDQDEDTLSADLSGSLQPRLLLGHSFEPRSTQIFALDFTAKRKVPLEEAIEDFQRAWLSLTILKLKVVEAIKPHAITTSSNDSQKTFETIEAWLQLCNQHEKCREWTTVLGRADDFVPSRLLKISGEETQSPLKLVLSSDLERPFPKYAALSYCWGDAALPVLTTTNLQAHRSSISRSSLPQTFQDAVDVARRLRIGYLWIDALCIVQDDMRDWEHEAQRMADVYSHAYVTFSATASRNADEGLFHSREPNLLCSIVVPQDRASQRGLVIYHDNWSTSVEKSVLSKRAWTVQERFLSPRLLHFAQDQVYWECQQLYTAENLPIAFSATPDSIWTMKKALLSSRDYTELYSLWQQVVCCYSRGALSRPMDRAMAVTGLAKVFAPRFKSYDASSPGSNYVCGLWRDNLVRDLLWYRDGENWRVGSESRLSGFPYWSWLSLCGATIGFRVPPMAAQTAQLVDISPSTYGVSPFHHRPYAELVLRAPLCKALLRSTVTPSEYDPYTLQLSHGQLQRFTHFALYPDDLQHDDWVTALSGDIYLALCRSFEKGYRSSVPLIAPTSGGKLSLLEGTSFECLILLADKRPSHYRRVGLVIFTKGWSPIVDFNISEDELFAHEVLRKSFLSNDLSEHVRGPPDPQAMYTLTLV